jgi:hypothetical protein
MAGNGAASEGRTIVLVHGLWLTPRSWEGCPRWEEVADYALDWATGHAREPAPA